MTLIKPLVVGLGTSILVFLAILGLGLVAMAFGIAMPFVSLAATGSGGLGAWSAGFSESALTLAVVAGILGFGFSHRRERRRQAARLR